MALWGGDGPASSHYKLQIETEHKFSFSNQLYSSMASCSFLFVSILPKSFLSLWTSNRNWTCLDFKSNNIWSWSFRFPFEVEMVENGSCSFRFVFRFCHRLIETHGLPKSYLSLRTKYKLNKYYQKQHISIWIDSCSFP